MNISATERECSTVFCTQFMFDDQGNLLGKHRKLKPMTSERMIWGEADASTMLVYPTSIGRLGSLISIEYMMPAEIMVMCAQMEEIHLASYPALPKNSVTYRTFEPHLSLAISYVISNACYFIMKPDAQIISNRLDENEEGIVTADIDLSIIGVKNFFMDTAGHYCNPAISLAVDMTPKKPVTLNGLGDNASMKYEEILVEGGI